MANTRLQNIAGLFTNIRTRNIILITGAIFVGIILLGIYQLMHMAGPQVQAGAGGGLPPKLESTPEFNQAVTPEQENLVQTTNQQAATSAQKAGTSAIDSAVGGPTGDDVFGPNSDDSLNLNSGQGQTSGTTPGVGTPPSTTTTTATKTSADKDKDKKNANQADAAQLAELKRLQDQQRQAQQQQQDAALKAEQQAVQDLTDSMQNQAKAIFSSWSGGKGTALQFYVEAASDTKPNEKGTTTNKAGSQSSVQTPEGAEVPPAVNTPAAIKAGDVLFAILDTSVNSDEPGPILATVVSGNYKGAKIVGGLQPMQQITGTNGPTAVTLTFKTMNVPSQPNSININAVAIDAETARTALASDVDHHYLYRYGTTFAASFLEGYGNAITQSGSISFNNANGTQTTFQQQLTPRQEVLAALGQVGTDIGNQLSNALQRPNTITVDAGLSVGILFLSDVVIQ